MLERTRGFLRAAKTVLSLNVRPPGGRGSVAVPARHIAADEPDENMPLADPGAFALY